MSNQYEYTFGFPDVLRSEEIAKRLKCQREQGNVSTLPLDYQGQVQPLQTIEVPIGLPVYRIENIRTKTLQKEWLAQKRHEPDFAELIGDDFFDRDPHSIQTQEVQHGILEKLIDAKGLLKLFQNPKEKQIEAIICSSDGIVVNGNRRLCTWRKLYLSDKIRYGHFQTVRIALLPNNDKKALHNLEVSLQINPDYRSDYAWHAKVADDKEQFKNGVSIFEIAQRKQMAESEILIGMACYDYAEKYLEKIGHKDEWSLVDDKHYAIRKIVQCEKNLASDTTHKHVFSELAHSILEVPASDERSYSFIPKVSTNIKEVAARLAKKFEIPFEKEIEQNDPLAVEPATPEETQMEKLTQKLKEITNPQEKVDAVKQIVETIEALAKEKKQIESVFEYVKKAATELANAVTLSQAEGMSKCGVGDHLDGIEGAVKSLRQWLQK